MPRFLLDWSQWGFSQGCCEGVLPRSWDLHQTNHWGEQGTCHCLCIKHPLLNRCPPYGRIYNFRDLILWLFLFQFVYPEGAIPLRFLRLKHAHVRQNITYNCDGGMDGFMMMKLKGANGDTIQFGDKTIRMVSQVSRVTAPSGLVLHEFELRRHPSAYLIIRTLCKCSVILYSNEFVRPKLEFYFVQIITVSSIRHRLLKLPPC